MNRDNAGKTSFDDVNSIQGLGALLRIKLISDIQPIMKKLFRDKKELIAFDLSTGRTTREIEELSGVGKDRVSKLWKRWARAGLGTRRSVSGGMRFLRTVDPHNLGLHVPKYEGQEKKTRGSQI
ncbi:MAG: hypothetical protein ACOC38_10590, partial [Promethearchaeia archaeon]